MNYDIYRILKDLGIEMDRAYSGCYDTDYDTVDDYYDTKYYGLDE